MLYGGATGRRRRSASGSAATRAAMRWFGGSSSGGKKEYSSQMPVVIIGIDKWMRQTRTLVESLLLAIAEGGDSIKSSGAALRKGAEVAAACFKEANAGADYWEKYFKGTQEKD